MLTMKNASLLKEILWGVVSLFVSRDSDKRISFPQTIGFLLGKVIVIIVIVGAVIIYTEDNFTQELTVSREKQRRKIAQEMAQMLYDCEYGSFSSWIRIDSNANSKAGMFLSVFGCNNPQCKEIIDYSVGRNCYQESYILDPNTINFLTSLTDGMPTKLNQQDIIDLKLYAMADITNCTGVKYDNNYLVLIQVTQEMVWLFTSNFIDNRKCDAAYKLQQIAKLAINYF